MKNIHKQEVLEMQPVKLNDRVQIYKGNGFICIKNTHTYCMEATLRINNNNKTYDIKPGILYKINTGYKGIHIKCKFEGQDIIEKRNNEISTYIEVTRKDGGVKNTLEVLGLILDIITDIFF